MATESVWVTGSQEVTQCRRPNRLLAGRLRIC